MTKNKNKFKAKLQTKILLLGHGSKWDIKLIKNYSTCRVELYNSVTYMLSNQVNAELLYNTCMCSTYVCFEYILMSFNIKSLKEIIVDSFVIWSSMKKCFCFFASKMFVYGRYARGVCFVIRRFSSNVSLLCTTTEVEAIQTLF